MPLLLQSTPFLRRSLQVGATRAEAIPSITAFYGVGAGQIPMDMRFDSASKLSISDGRVVGVTNDGGAGPYFSASAPEASAPKWDSVAEVPRFMSPSAMTLAQPANLSGVHALMAFQLPLRPASQNTMLFVDTATQNGFQLFVPSGGPRLRFITPGFTHYPGSAPFSLFGKWVIAEYRWANGEGALIVNGVIRSVVASNPVDFYVNMIRGPYSTDETSAIGRCISVVCAPENTAANPEPAVIAARNLLAERYDVLLDQ